MELNLEHSLIYQTLRAVYSQTERERNPPPHRKQMQVNSGMYAHCFHTLPDGLLFCYFQAGSTKTF